MRLSSLSLQGFKSFGNRTLIEFAPGVTAIIGPNGSGKSNLIDALKWTTGGGRAREFRASDKTDLIFHGASGKRGVGLAEVEVELRGDGRAVKVYRSLDREGTTRLRLNGRNARFLDVDEILAGSGLGRSGVALIGQGEVSQVLMADPPKLLEYVAEVAGVGRMSSRREQTQARLETARGHLDRLNDVLIELEGRCERLAEEATDAERHARLSAEVLTLRVTAARRRVDALNGEVAALEQRRAELRGAIEEGRERLQALRSEMELARRERDDREEAYRSALAEAELKRGDLRVAEERAQRARERREGARAALAAARREAERLEALEPPTAPEGDPAPLAEREAATAEALAGSERELAEARAALQEAETALQALRDRQAAAERQAASYEAQRDELERQADELASRLQQLAAAPRENLTFLEEAEREARAAAEAHAGEVDAARTRLAEAHERHAGTEAERQAWGRALERQRAAFEARRGYAQGPRNALTSGIDGVLGSVGDLLRVPERYRTAVAAALGRRAEYVVVERADTGRAVLRWVRERGGYVTVLPLELLRPGGRRPSRELLARPGVVAPAAEVVEVAAPYRVVVEQLLGGTVLVDTLESATALARSDLPRARLVTLEGDILEASGAMSGGRRGGQPSVLGAAAELEQAEAAEAAARAEADRARAELDARRREAQALEQRRQDILAAHEAAREALGQARQRASRNDALLEELTGRAQAVEAARAGLHRPTGAPDPAGLEAAAGAAQAARARVEALHRVEGERHRSLAELRQQRLLLEERLRSYHEARQRYRDERARASELRTEVGRQQEALRGLEAAAEAAEAARAGAEAALPTGLEAAEAALAQIRQCSEALDAELAQATEEQAGRGQELEGTHVQLARREAALELANEEVAGYPRGAEPLELSERVARSRLREAEQALEALGPVNHRASRDLREARERKDGLEVEAVQATLAVTELEGTLQRIDRETTVRLHGALSRLRQGFQGHVQQLFGAEGRGDIEVEQRDGRPVGVRIRLQPPGKQTQSLHLLSVGERTMGALAFLFALMGDETPGSGLPIAVLDEVDAPLDEANIRRYCAFLERLAKRGTQFVLITHQKATFEVADVLWGVTTEEGVSRVFSIRRDEAPAAR